MVLLNKLVKQISLFLLLWSEHLGLYTLQLWWITGIIQWTIIQVSPSFLRSRWYSIKIIADYVDYLELHTNTSAQTESLLHCLKQAARGISLYMNSDNTAFNQDGAIFSLN